VRQYAAAKRTEHDARLAISSAMVGTGCKWRQIDGLVHELTFS
jgi:hypothetical protein